MGKIYKLILLLFIISGFLAAQEQNPILGIPCKDCVYNQKSQPVTIQNGSGTINTSYTTTACGLNFTQASLRLHQRGVSALTPSVGVAQPAAFLISGIPACANIVKAFLYSGTSGNGVNVTASITNPMSLSANFSMTVVGAHIDKCWSYTGSFTYRADVTSIISGNGNYMISGLPVVVGTNDTDGATLIIIYSDPSQNYTGSIVIADGMWALTGGVATNTIGGFNVCGPTIFTSNFIITSDLQKIANAQLYFNSATPNYTLTAANQSMWNFVQAPGTIATSSQTSANFGISELGDYFAFLAAGMYYRTYCNTCTVPSFSVSTAVSSSCTVGSATATPVGGTGPYTYTWSPTGGNSAVISGVSIGNYTVTIKDASCAVSSATVAISASPTIACVSTTICSPGSATLTATGATTYSWSTSATTSQIVVSPSVTTVYTVTGSNGPCSNTQTVSVTVGSAPFMTASTSNSFICAGQTVTLSATGAISYTYNPGGITGNPIALNPMTSTTYTVIGSNGGPCTGFALITQSVSPCTGVDQLSAFDFVFGIYPNPNNGVFDLIVTELTGNYFIEIYNSLGQLVLYQNSKEKKVEININEQANGIYQLRVIQNGRQVYRTKLIKE